MKPDWLDADAPEIFRQALYSKRPSEPSDVHKRRSYNFSIARLAAWLRRIMLRKDDKGDSQLEPRRHSFAKRRQSCELQNDFKHGAIPSVGLDKQNLHRSMKGGRDHAVGLHLPLFGAAIRRSYLANSVAAVGRKCNNGAHSCLLTRLMSLPAACSPRS